MLNDRAESLHLRVPSEAKELLEQLADARGDKSSASDIVREALNEYLNKRDINVPLSVQKRGGDRRSKEARKLAV